MEIVIMRKLNHPNIMKLQEYMEHDIAELLSNLDIKSNQPQIKWYMKQ